LLLRTPTLTAQQACTPREVTSLGALLPALVWCHIAEFCDLSSTGAVLNASAGLLDDSDRCNRGEDVHGLWKQQAFLCGAASRVEDPGACDWIQPRRSTPRASRFGAAPCDWQALCRGAVRSRGGAKVVVRILWWEPNVTAVVGADLQLPLPAASLVPVLCGDCSGVRELAKTLADIIVPQMPQPVDTAPPAPRSNSKKRRISELRMRHLQWGGRPGPVVKGLLMEADHMLLELPLLHGGWALPPANANLGKRAPKMRCPTLIKLVAEGDSDDWLLGFAGETWITVDLCMPNLHGLYQAILDGVRPSSESQGLLELHLLEVGHSGAESLVAASRPLRSLAWAHSETLRLEGQRIEALADANRPRPTWRILLRREQELQVPFVRSLSAASPALLDELPPSPLELVNLAARRAMLNSSSGSASAVADSAPSAPNPADEAIDGAAPQPQQQQLLAPCLLWPASAPSLPLIDPAAAAMPLPAPPQAMLDSLPILSLPFVASPTPPSPATTAIAQGLRREGVGAAMGPSLLKMPPRLLHSTQGARQFEFHPSLPEVLLVGDTRGGVHVARIPPTDARGEQRRAFEGCWAGQQDDSEADGTPARTPLVLDDGSVLALAWMRHHPQVALCGGAGSGRITFLRYNPRASDSEPELDPISTAVTFGAPLSSLSVNCSDDFLLASGSSADIVVYDTQTGCPLQRGAGVHDHLINISRFAHGLPHIFATASLDQTCKIWDLRLPLVRERPVKVLHTGGPNIMCNFSPDDMHLLCSGVGEHLVQFELPSWRRAPESFPLRSPVVAGQASVRFRRSAYLSSSQHFATAATGESVVRLMSSAGADLGAIDLSGLGRRAGLLLGGDVGRLHPDMYRHLRLQVRQEPSRTAGVTEAFPFAVAAATAASANFAPYPVDELAGAEKVSVQSLRAHPSARDCLGALLCLSGTDGPQRSCVALLNLDPTYRRGM